MSTIEGLYGACSEIEVALDCLFRRQGYRAAYADNALAKIRVAVGDGVFQFRSEPPTRWKCTKCGEQYNTEKGNPPKFPEPAPAEQGEERPDLGVCTACHAILDPPQIERYGKSWGHVIAVGDPDEPEPAPCGPVTAYYLAARPQPESAKNEVGGEAWNKKFAASETAVKKAESILSYAREWGGGNDVLTIAQGLDDWFQSRLASARTSSAETGLREALETIAKYASAAEAESEGVDHENIAFEAGYTECIRIARAALAARPQPKESIQLAIAENTRQDMLAQLPSDLAEKLKNAHIMDVWMVIADRLIPKEPKESATDARELADSLFYGLSCGIRDGKYHFPRPPEEDKAWAAALIQSTFERWKEQYGSAIASVLRKDHAFDNDEAVAVLNEASAILETIEKENQG